MIDLKKIVLVNVGKEVSVYQPNLGICYLASHLRKSGFDVQIIDEVSGDGIDKIKNPDIVGLSCTTAFINRSFRLAETIKRKFNVPIVLGGAHTTALPEQTLKNKSIDYVVLGEGELPMRNIMEEKDPKNIKALGYKDGGEIKVNKEFDMIKNLDEAPFPARDLIDMDFYLGKKDIFPDKKTVATTIFTSRGCPYKCYFCSANVVRGRGMRFHSAEYVMKELKHIIRTYKLKGFMFMDDLFLMNKDRLFDICDMMTKANFNRMPWISLARADSIDDETMKAIKGAGCTQLNIGFETGNQRILNMLKSNTTTVEQNKQAIEMCKIHGIRVFGYFMIGNPTETDDELNDTINFIKSNPLDYIAISTATPYPATKMWDDYVKNYNVDVEKISNWEEFYHGKNTFFVEKDREESFNRKWRDLNRYEFMKNYSRNPLMILKRAFLRPSYAVSYIKSFLRRC